MVPMAAQSQQGWGNLAGLVMAVWGKCARVCPHVCVRSFIFFEGESHLPQIRGHHVCPNLSSNLKSPVTLAYIQISPLESFRFCAVPTWEVQFRMQVI